MQAQAGEISLERMSRACGVGRSGYAAWREQGCTSQHERADEHLTEQIQAIYEMRGQTYGSPGLYNALKAQGLRCSRQRLARLMRAAGLEARPARRRAQTTQADAQQRSVSNWLDRDFSADAPNRKWLVDITAMWTAEGWRYLAAVLDVFSRRMVGWAMAEQMPDELTQQPLEMALLERRPPDQLLHQADPASHYTSHDYQPLLAKHHILTRFSGLPCCYHNAPMQRFWPTLNTQLIYPQPYHTREEAKIAVFADIQGCYYRQPRHSTLAFLSPEQFEQQFHS